LLEELGITSIPTFKFWVNGVATDLVVGEDIPALTQAVDKNLVEWQVSELADFAQVSSNSVEDKL
jgi:hypothetical protein